MNQLSVATSVVTCHILVITCQSSVLQSTGQAAAAAADIYFCFLIDDSMKEQNVCVTTVGDVLTSSQSALAPSTGIAARLCRDGEGDYGNTKVF